MARAAKESLHPAEQYARDVLEGKIVACKWVKLACERYFHDLEHGHERGLYFDRAAAERKIKFTSLLKHSKGQWAGEFFKPEPWQQFIDWNVFGWMRADGTRRFRALYEEVARKNGKSTHGATTGIYLAFADGEPGAEVYSAATKRDQARIVHSEAIRMVKKNRALRKHIKIYKDNLHMEASASKYEPLGADSDSIDGLNVHGVLGDEIHAWKSREMWEVLDTATGSRRQPLFVAITTAGMDRQSICFEKHEYTRKVLEGFKDGSFVDDTWFGIIFTIDEGDDWRDEACWIKANPNLGVSKKLDDLRMKAKRAEKMPASQNNFKRRELNIWVQGETKWMDMEAWRKCGGLIDALDLPDHLKDRTCYAGLDLSSTNDLTALALVFPDDQGFYDVFLRFWLPEDVIETRTQEGTHYDQWVKEGYITKTDGNVIDYEWIFFALKEDLKNHRIERLAYDRWGASRVVQVLQNMGIEVVQFGQGFVSMNPPMKELERLVLAGQLRHGNNPVLTWMADNLVARMDPAGNIKPDKEKSKEKIDGMVTLIMALDLALRRDPAEDMSAIMSDDWGM
jgi:phage terminase large subunit-like protein